MNPVTIHWDVVIALYIFFSWCHGGIVFWVPIAIFYSNKILNVYNVHDIMLESLKNKNYYFGTNYMHIKLCGIKYESNLPPNAGFLYQASWQRSNSYIKISMKQSNSNINISTKEFIILVWHNLSLNILNLYNSSTIWILFSSTNNLLVITLC